MYCLKMLVSLDYPEAKSNSASLRYWFLSSFTM